MKLEDLIVIIKEVLEQAREMSGHVDDQIVPTTVPIGDLVGFDSLNAVEVTVLVQAKLECEIPGDINLFVSEDGLHALTIRQIAERIRDLLPQDQE